jgi:hypothetical protein
MAQAWPALLAHGHAVDLILAVIVVEFAALSVRRPLAHGALTSRILAFAPGVCLLLALRAALTGSNWIWVAVFLAASFPVHVGDLMRRRL